jgi:hypothetical protein
MEEPGNILAIESYNELPAHVKEVLKYLLKVYKPAAPGEECIRKTTAELQQQITEHCQVLFVPGILFKFMHESGFEYSMDAQGDFYWLLKRK